MYQALYLKIQAHFIVSGDIKSPLDALFECNGVRMLWQLRRYKHYANASRCSVVLTPFILLLNIPKKHVVGQKFKKGDRSSKSKRIFQKTSSWLYWTELFL